MNRSAPAPHPGLGTRRTVFVIFLLLAAAMPVTAIGGCSRRVAQPPPPPPPETGVRPGDKVQGTVVPEAEWPEPVRDWVSALEESAKPLATTIVVGDDVYFVVLPATAAVFRSLELTFSSDWEVFIDPLEAGGPATPLVARIPGVVKFWDWFSYHCSGAWVPCVVDGQGVGPAIIPEAAAVVVVSPGEGATVGVPVHLTGYAKMPGAEIGFRVRDPSGQLLLET